MPEHQTQLRMRIKAKPLSGGRFLFRCPGCKGGHIVATVKIPGQPCWAFNGDCEKPTFSPSILYKTANGVVCHSFVRDGKIQFLKDSAHELAGQTVDLPDIAEVIDD